MAQHWKYSYSDPVSVSVDRYSTLRSKYLVEGDRRAQIGGRLLDFHYLPLLVSPLQAPCISQHLRVP